MLSNVSLRISTPLICHPSKTSQTVVQLHIPEFVRFNFRLQVLTDIRNFCT